MEASLSQSNVRPNLNVVDAPETPSPQQSACSNVTRLMLPVLAFAATATAGFTAAMLLANGRNEVIITAVKPIAWVAAGNLLTAALIERVSSCFGNKMKGLTTDTLMGTCFPILTLAGSFHLLKIIGPRGEMPIFNPV